MVRGGRLWGKPQRWTHNDCIQAGAQPDIIAYTPVQNCKSNTSEKFAGMFEGPIGVVNRPVNQQVIMSAGEVLTAQLRGRARFLRQKGKIKSPDLMERAALMIEQLENGNAK